MGKIYFTRHGETDFNVKGLVCGASECDLTQNGIEQAREAGQKLKEQGIKFDAIYYSPKRRARDTALIIAEELKVKAIEEPLITERDCGCFEVRDRHTPEFKASQKRIIMSNDGKDGTGKIRHGETMLKVTQRIYNFLDKLTANENKDKNFLIVGHNGIARNVRSYFVDMENEEFTDFKMKNCEVMEFEF